MVISPFLKLRVKTMNSQIKTMLEMQDAMNSKVTKDWRGQNYAWYRAIWIECGELLDHYGWKWWKKQEPDMEQVVLELIDIWHFGLSILLVSAKNNDELAAQIEADLVIDASGADFREAVEVFAEKTLATKSFSVASFGVLMGAAGLTFEQLYASYVGKNVLNFFRQDKGYKEGNYIKNWNDGREDNEHLAEIVQQLDTSRADFRDAVYNALDSRYPK